MLRIFKYGHIQHTSRTTDNELNVLIILNAFLRHNIQESYTLKMIRFLAHPVCICRDSRL